MNNNVSCASLEEINRLSGYNLFIIQCVNLFAAIITFIFTYFAINFVLKHSILQNSTKILLFSNLFYALLYQICYSIEAVTIIHKHFYKIDKPCELLQLESVCEPYMKTLLTCTSGMIYCQTGLILERTLATFIKDYQGKKRIIIGSSIALFVFISSVFTTFITYWNDKFSSAVVACYQFPRESAYRSLLYFWSITIITVFNFVTSILLNKYNSKLEYQIRFKIKARFHKREVIQSTETICFLTTTQFFCIFVGSLGISILKSIRSRITPEQYHEWANRFYTVPFIAMLFPILLVYRISKINSFRTQIISGLTTTKQTQEEHINQMKIMWK